MMSPLTGLGFRFGEWAHHQTLAGRALSWVRLFFRRKRQGWRVNWRMDLAVERETPWNAAVPAALPTDGGFLY